MAKSLLVEGKELRVNILTLNGAPIGLNLSAVEMSASTEVIA